MAIKCTITYPCTLKTRFKPFLKCRLLLLAKQTEAYIVYTFAPCARGQNSDKRRVRKYFHFQLILKLIK